jgi:uncharacterized protein YbjT (DUF2867 family)
MAGDLRDPAALRRAAEGAELVYHICPNVDPAEMDIGRAALEAARQAGVRRFVYHSVLHPQTEAMPHHWAKLRVEEALFASGLAFTILQPAPYMQNLRASWRDIVERGEYPVPYAAHTRLSLVDLEDVAEAAATVLLDEAHAGATYELAGTRALAQTEVAATLGEALGRDVRAVAVPRSDWERRARAGGMNDYAVATLLRMFEYYERHGLEGAPGVLAWLLQREPGDLNAYVRRISRE